MGKGISVELAKHKHQVHLLFNDQYELRDKIEEDINQSVLKYDLNVQSIIKENNLVITGDSSHVNQCDILIEAVVENLNSKRQVLFELKKFIHPKMIVNVNTKLGQYIGAKLGHS